MSAIVGALWPILRTYRPGTARDRQTVQPKRFGAFVTTYAPPGYGVFQPRNDKEAQRMYNHIRTVAFWLDAAPVLAELGLPFRAGIDDIISLVPIYGDLVSGILQLYQVWLCFVFGVPTQVLIHMIFNVLLDVIVGFVPIIGDILDNLFKSNLRNLALLEEYLLTSPIANKKYHILLMPDSTEFLPRPRTARFSSSWFGAKSGSGGITEEVERERETGKVKMTRRMARDEGEFMFGVPDRSTAGDAAREPTHAPLD